MKRKNERSGETGTHGIHAHPAPHRKSAGQTQGQFARDPKRRHGQFGGAGNPPLIQK